MDTAAYLEHRPRMLGLAYRMLGSRSEAEDVLSDAYLRVREIDADSPRAYLSRVVTRLCLDRLKSAASRRETYVGTWLPEPWADSPESDFEHRESLEFAFLLLLERLNPAERAAFLLREVFEHDYPEIAETLQLSPDNCRQLVHRARLHMGKPRSRPVPPPDRVLQLLQGFRQACQEGDLAGLKRLLAEDVLLLSDGGGKVTAATRPVEGADRVARFVLGVAAKRPPSQTRVITLNGRPALWLDNQWALLWDLTDDGRLERVYAIRNPDKLVSLATIL